MPSDVKEASRESSKLVSAVSSILTTENSAERSKNAYADVIPEDNSTKANTLDKSKSSIDTAGRKKSKEFQHFAVQRLSKNGYEEARKVMLRNTPLEAIRK